MLTNILLIAVFILVFLLIGTILICMKLDRRLTDEVKANLKLMRYIKENLAKNNDVIGD